MHDVNACEANPISSQDLLDLDDSVDCRIFENPKKLCEVDRVEDPELDVEARINKQIDKSIADVLSEIVQNAFQQSFENVIDFQA